MSEISRREFFKKAMAAGIAGYGVGRLARSGLFAAVPPAIGPVQSDLVVVRNGAPAQLVRRAVEALGGMAKFVKPGNVVVVKPNIGWDRLPEQAANTNPELVAEVVRMCREAGAAKVKIFDRPCNEAKRCYLRSGIQKAAEEAGAQVSFVYDAKFKRVPIPKGELLNSWEIYDDVLNADVLINVPIAKNHGIPRLTLSFKNLMGVLGGDRGLIHERFAHKIVDINTVVRPQLTILDAVRILMRNGPQGGNLADVKQLNTVVTGVDAVAVDAFGATLFGLTPNDLEYLKVASARGLGQMNLKEVKIQEINLS